MSVNPVKIEVVETNSASSKKLNRSSFLINLLLSLLWLGVFIFQLFSQLAVTLLVTRNNWSVPDFKDFYTSVLVWHQTGQLYPDDATRLYSTYKIVNGSPPAANFPFLLLASFPLEIALLIWYLVSLAGLALVGRWLVTTYLPGRSRKFYAWLFLLIYCSSPLFMFIYLANWTALLTVFVIAAWYYLRKGAEIKGGIWLGLALVIRLHPGLVLLYLLITKRWKAAGATAGTFTALNVLALMVFGWSNYLDWLRQGMNFASGYTSNRYEHSWLGLTDSIVHLFNEGTQVSDWARWSYYLLSLLTVGGALYLTRKLDFDRAYSLALIAGLLVVVPSWEYYSLFLVLPLALLWRSYPVVVGYVFLRWLLHNSTLLINFGRFDNLFWTITLIGGMAALAFCLYQSSTRAKTDNIQIENS
jgi:alpha-1,2-mannosyltransferase